MTMPPLPEPDVLWPDRYHGDERAYSDDAMRAYGAACAAAATAAAAEVAQQWGDTHEPGETVNARNASSKIARAIRARGEGA